MTRTDYRHRSSELGLLEGYLSFNSLRTGKGVADHNRLTELSNTLKNALGLPMGSATDEQLGAAVEVLKTFARGLDRDDEMLALLMWNLDPLDFDSAPERLPPIPHGEWMSRCNVAALSGEFLWKDESSIRKHCDRVAFLATRHFSALAAIDNSNGRGLQPLGFQGVFSAAVFVTTSPAEYKRLILGVEESARTISRFPKRIATIFKSEVTVKELATKRYGEGSSHIAHYLEEHRERRRLALDALSKGLVLREVYSVQELLSYVQSGRHSPGVRLKESSIANTVTNWIEALESNESYCVGLTEDPLPFKFEVVDDKIVIMHEVVGKSDSNRINSIALEGDEIAERFLRDFETVWDAIPVEFRTRSQVVSWLSANLLTQRRSENDE